MNTLLKVISIAMVTLIAVTQTSCDNNGNAQQVSEQLEATFSGSFVTATVNSDTNGDGRPSFNRTYIGQSNLGELNIYITDEFAQPMPPIICPEDTLEFLLVSGSFVIRVPDGDLLLGELLTAVSCFDPETRTSEIHYTGQFTKGTGSFEEITGDLDLTINSDFLNLTSESGFASGGSTGVLFGDVEFP